jgi:hypothetical protein
MEKGVHVWDLTSKIPEKSWVAGDFGGVHEIYWELNRRKPWLSNGTYIDLVV